MYDGIQKIKGMREINAAPFQATTTKLNRMRRANFNDKMADRRFGAFLIFQFLVGVLEFGIAMV
jgi:hypothetical protein